MSEGRLVRGEVYALAALDWDVGAGTLMVGSWDFSGRRDAAGS